MIRPTAIKAGIENTRLCKNISIAFVVGNTISNIVILLSKREHKNVIKLLNDQCLVPINQFSITPLSKKPSFLMSEVVVPD